MVEVFSPASTRIVCRTIYLHCNKETCDSIYHTGQFSSRRLRWTQCSLSSCSTHITQDARRSTANSLSKLSQVSYTGSETASFSFQSFKLESAGKESTYFVTDIRAETLLVRQSAEVSVLKTEENFNSCETFNKPFPRNNTNAISGHTSASGRETLYRHQTCPTPFTHQRTAVKGIRGRERHFSCDICKIIFNSRYNLERHARVHTGERPFSSEVCKKRFSLRSNIMIHLRLHTGERNFSCVICKKQFAQRSSIKKHRSVHTGERPFSCKMCNKSFTQSSN
jgi:uncharacterized Zn-finger protein